MPDPDEGRFQSPLRAIPLPENYVSRRRLLLGAKTAVGLGLVAGAADLVPLGPVSGWTPAPDTWPLARYDLSNTAATDAPPPTDPSVAWSYDGLENRDETTLVVGPDRVYAGGDGLAAIDRADGTESWLVEDVDTGELALRDGGLYSGTATEGAFGVAGVDAGVFAWDPATGTRAWARDLPLFDDTQVTSLHVADGTVFVGLDGGAAAYDAASGRRRWSGPNGGFDPTYFGFHGGSLYAVVGDRLARFAPRDLLDVPLGDGASPRWVAESPATDVHQWPVVTDEEVVVPRLPVGPGAVDELVVACGPAGSVRWTALEGPDDEYAYGISPAVADGAVFTGWQVNDTADSTTLVALDAVDGSVRWRVPGPASARPVTAIADDIALVGFGSRSTGEAGVSAYALDTGEERWRVDLPRRPAAIAPVEGTLFVACANGTVHALRD